MTRRNAGILTYTFPSLVTTGWVYAISDGTHIKVGFTTGKPQARLRTFQTGNAKRLALVVAVQGTIAMELAYHEYHQKTLRGQRHVRGEWYDIMPLDVVEFCLNWMDVPLR